jgi:hypothetical protein
MSKIEGKNKFNPQSIDAKVWAKEFMRLYDNNKLRPINAPDWVDEGLMIGWFANAIMAGYDGRKHEQAINKTRLSEGELEEVLDKSIFGKALSGRWVRWSKNIFGITTYLEALKRTAHAIYEAGRKKG